MAKKSAAQQALQRTRSANLCTSTERRRQHRESIGRCQRCNTRGSIDALTLHHIEPLSAGGPDAPCNWCVLCSQCHQLWHDYEAECRLVIARQRFRPWLEKGWRGVKREGEMPRL